MTSAAKEEAIAKREWDELGAKEEAIAKREWDELDFEEQADAMIAQDRWLIEHEVLKMLHSLDLSGLDNVLQRATELKRKAEEEQRVQKRVEPMMKTVRDCDASLNDKTEAFERLRVIALEEGVLRKLTSPSIYRTPWGGFENFWEEAVFLMEEAVAGSRAAVQSPENVPHTGSAVPVEAAAAH